MASKGHASVAEPKTNVVRSFNESLSFCNAIRTRLTDADVAVKMHSNYARKEAKAVRFSESIYAPGV